MTHVDNQTAEVADKPLVLAVGGFLPERMAVMRVAHECADIRDPVEALQYFRVNGAKVSAAVISLRMPALGGCELMEELHRLEPALPVIISTHITEVDSVVNAMERGAFSYIYEPNLIQQLPLLLERAISHMTAIRENRRLQNQIARQDCLRRFVGISSAARATVALIAKVADSTVPVLILGESGTGKEVAARLIHDLSSRQSAPFVAVNCGALAPALLESELFGYAKGAFTGAAKDRAGLFEQADGGTLFLDELGVTDGNFQMKLLRVLEDGEIRRVGDQEPRRVSVRIVAATNQPLDQAMKDGSFREDLFHRLNVVPVALAPLRERREDIPVLAYHFLEQLLERYPAAPQKISSAALGQLEAYSWPGNVRELRNVVEHAVLLGSGDTIRPSDLPARLKQPALPVMAEGQGLDAVLASLEKELIAGALAQAKGNQSKAAQALRIKRTTLLARMSRYGL